MFIWSFFLTRPLQSQPLLKPNDVFVCVVLFNFMYVLSTYLKIDLFMVSNASFVTGQRRLTSHNILILADLELL